jgi:hypothetical protein
VDSRHFNGVEIQDVSQIVTAIKDAGGFEAVLNEQRNKGESGDSEDAEEREINAKEIATQAKAAVQTATAIATIDMQITNAPDGIVLLIGRYVGGKVEVVDDIPLEAGEVESMVSRVSDDLLPPISESAEFVARVLALGGAAHVLSAARQRREYPVGDLRAPRGLFGRHQGHT